MCCTPVPHSPSGRIHNGRNPTDSTDQVQESKTKDAPAARRWGKGAHRPKQAIAGCNAATLHVAEYINVKVIKES